MVTAGHIAVLNRQVWLWYCRKWNPYELLLGWWVFGNWCAVSAALKHYLSSSNSWSLIQLLYCTCISELTMTRQRFFRDAKWPYFRYIYFWNVLTVSIQREPIHASVKKTISYAGQLLNQLLYRNPWLIHFKSTICFYSCGWIIKHPQFYF